MCEKTTDRLVTLDTKTDMRSEIRILCLYRERTVWLQFAARPSQVLGILITLEAVAFSAVASAWLSSLQQTCASFDVHVQTHTHTLVSIHANTSNVHDYVHTRVCAYVHNNMSHMF